MNSANSTGSRLQSVTIPPVLRNEKTRIEHRLFSEISKNWAGIPLVDLQTAIKYIRKTRTEPGLKVTATLNPKRYFLKERVPVELQDRVLINRYHIFPKLNYTLCPSGN